MKYRAKKFELVKEKRKVTPLLVSELQCHKKKLSWDYPFERQGKEA